MDLWLIPGEKINRRVTSAESIRFLPKGSNCFAPVFPIYATMYTGVRTIFIKKVPHVKKIILLNQRSS